MKRYLKHFISAESAGGVALMAAAALALLIANSPLAQFYFDLLHLPLFGSTIVHWINDGLMALFFLVVGLEIKRQWLQGELTSWQARALPGIAALGGMIVPAIIYLSFNWSDPLHARGWAIPAATDIAFALGVLTLLGRLVPASLKVFLTTLAIIDDMGAVAIIAVFYSEDLSLLMLGGAVLIYGLLYLLNRAGTCSLWPYLLLGGLLWALVLKSGVHATIAGLMLGFVIPLRLGRAEDSPLRRLEHRLHPLSTFFIVPLFGFANAGIAFGALPQGALTHPVTLGIVAGLFLGKQIGVLGFSWLTIRLGLAQLPPRAQWTHMVGVSILCGIGLTMSLFIGLLAFADAPELQNLLKLGVLIGSIVSGLVGALFLVLAGRKGANPHP